MFQICWCMNATVINFHLSLFLLWTSNPDMSIFTINVIQNFIASQWKWKRVCVCRSTLLGFRIGCLCNQKWRITAQLNKRTQLPDRVGLFSCFHVRDFTHRTLHYSDVHCLYVLLLLYSELHLQRQQGDWWKKQLRYVSTCQATLDLCNSYNSLISGSKWQCRRTVGYALSGQCLSFKSGHSGYPSVVFQEYDGMHGSCSSITRADTPWISD